MTATTNPDFHRICAFDLELRSRSAQRASTPSGFALRFPARAFWDLNFLYVERPATDADTLLSEADAALFGLEHRMLVVDEPPGGWEPIPLAAELAARGWTVEVLVAMVAGADAPPAPRALPPAGEVPAPDLLVPRRIGGRELGSDEATIAAIEQADAAIGRAGHERGFVSRAADGSVAAFARLYTDGTLGQIEDVQTLVAHRRAGHGEAVVRAALAASRAAGHALTFLWADADDFPRRLYTRLGFTVAGRRWRLRQVYS